MNQQLINELKKELEINCQKEETLIIEFIRKTIKQFHRDGAVIGLSGGLDSSMCAYLLEKALGKGKVLAVLLPERDSAAINRRHAHLVAKTLGLETVERDMTKTLQEIGVYDIGKKKLESEKEQAKYIKKTESQVRLFYGGYFYHDLLGAYYGEETSVRWKLLEKMAKKTINNDFAFQFTKVRLRMVYLYFYANQRHYAVIGTTDKSEYSTGIYCNYGDGANDMQILRHLYKTQIKQLAHYLNLPHTATLGMSYEELDMLLLAMGKGYPDEKLAEIVPKKGVDSIKQLRKVADLIRKLPLCTGDIAN